MSYDNRIEDFESELSDYNGHKEPFEEDEEPMCDCMPLGDIEIGIVNDGYIDPLGDKCYICDPLGDLDLYNEKDMGPITDYRQLLEVIKYNQEEQEQWYILLIFNPINRTPAVDSFLKNYQYLHDRTGNVHYFIPGLKNDAQLKGDIYDSDWRRFQLSEDAPLYMLFDQGGMLKTVDWLEENCPSYEYREGIDLILMKCYGQHSNAKLDVQNLICVPLEEVYHRGGNVIDAITFVRKIVSRNLPFRDAQKEIHSYLERNSGIYQPPMLKVFIAGSKDLYHERNVVRSQLQQISNRTKIAFSCYTYEDFSRDFVENGQQAEYNKFIANQADFAVFIIDGKIGGITFDEFNVAMSAFKNNGKPRIFTYCKDTDSDNPEIRHIINEINENHQYYCDYQDIYHLEHCIHRDFMNTAWELRR